MKNGRRRKRRRKKDGHLTDGAPLALPVALRHVIQRRIHAVDVVRDVALVAEQEAGLVVALTAALADGAVQTAPSLLQDHFGDFDVGAVGMVALAALGARHEPTLLVQTEASAHDASVLIQHETILRRTQHQSVLQDRFPGIARWWRSVNSFPATCNSIHFFFPFYSWIAIQLTLIQFIMITLQPTLI